MHIFFSSGLRSVHTTGPQQYRSRGIERERASRPSYITRNSKKWYHFMFRDKRHMQLHRLITGIGAYSCPFSPPFSSLPNVPFRRSLVFWFFFSLPLSHLPFFSRLHLITLPLRSRQEDVSVRSGLGCYFSAPSPPRYTHTCIMYIMYITCALTGDAHYYQQAN